MSLLPYALRPRVILRGQIIKRGVLGGNPVLRPLAMLMVGQGVYLRRSALRHGLILGSPLWRLIGVGLLLEGAYKRTLVKTPERLAVERLKVGHNVRVTVIEPTLSRRRRRGELKRLQAEAEASVMSSRQTS